jgi:glycosyltransferase 2 family protein
LADKQSSNARATALLVVVNLISVASLVWALHDAKLGELKDDLLDMSWWWVALAVVADIAVYVWHGWRWSLLLRPLVPIRFAQATRAIYVGLFANEVLPLRAGELLRCYLISRWTRLPFSVSISSAIIERIFDGVWLCSCLFVALKLAMLPRQFNRLVDGAWALGGVVLAGVLVLALSAIRRRKATVVRTLPEKGWRRQVAILIDDLGLISHSKYLPLSFLQSLPYLLLQVIPIWAAFKGYGFDLGLGPAFVLMVLLRLSSAIPQGPGNLGLFQFLTKECLEHVFNVVPAEAARFSLVLWGIVTLPLLTAGFVALTITEANVGELKRAAEEEAANLNR